jgi:hypothetical protein
MKLPFNCCQGCDGAGLGTCRGRAAQGSQCECNRMMVLVVVDACSTFFPDALP